MILFTSGVARLSDVLPEQNRKAPAGVAGNPAIDTNRVEKKFTLCYLNRVFKFAVVAQLN